MCMLKYGRYILGVCRQCREKHCGHLKQFLSTDSHTMASNIIPPRKRFPIPSKIYISLSVFEDSLISNKDYTHPVTPASAKGAYNNYVCKLHQACAINQPFRHLDSVLAKDWKELHPRIKRHYASFAKQGIRPVLELFAPGQAGPLWNHVKNSLIENINSSYNVCDSESGEDDEIEPSTLSDSTLQNFINAYNNEQSSKSRKEILSLFARNFKGSRLKQLIPDLTDSCIKEARKHCIKHGSGIAAPTPVIHRFFLSESKTEHFFRFMTRDVILQDTAYGTSKIKIESGEERLVRKPIRKLVPARIIAQYLKICDETEFKPASPRTLLRILEVCPASTRKSL